ncbi:MAG TPA: hypothetical protein PKW75_12425, partial [candidate division Zixibacteria bacterium]|nr:hypothetical protein [candidate division Zixibacteria bacterium]
SNLPYNFDAFYDSLHFEDFAENARWAGWIYDNPGVDTDSNGFAGRAHCQTRLSDGTAICLYNCEDTTGADAAGAEWDIHWYTGDGVPDFRGAAPPPAPKFQLIPSFGKVRVRFNGTYSETTEDPFVGLVDFEGYRIYIGRDDRKTSFSIVCGYDRENYNSFHWLPDRRTWEISPVPLTREELACRFGDSCRDANFDPLAYSMVEPLRTPAGELYYFTPQDFNRSVLGIPGAIRRAYPDQPKPATDDPRQADPDELAPDGLFKYYEYEYDIEGLLPSVPYWINVTALDYGSPRSGLPSLESAVTQGAQYVIPLSDPEKARSEELPIIVYPNPYRIDAEYRSLGFEGRGQDDRPDHRVRCVRFANLPPRCTIRIFSLDGDLIRTLEHDMPPSDPNAPYEEWDLITRNTQLVVSGLYYWTVEAEGRETQIGKLAVIK